MYKTLTRHGNSLAIVIEKPILELMKIEPDTPLEVSTDGERLIITPIREDRRKKFLAAKARVHGKYAAMFKRLAK